MRLTRPLKSLSLTSGERQQVSNLHRAESALERDTAANFSLYLGKKPGRWCNFFSFGGAHQLHSSQEKNTPLINNLIKDGDGQAHTSSSSPHKLSDMC